MQEMPGTNQADEIIEQAIFRLEENTAKIERCLNELSEEEIWKKPNNSSNSVGNLILHLCGNITQYIISSLGENEDNRKRNIEFETTSGYNRLELFKKLTETIDQAILTIKNLSDKDLLKFRSVQGFDYSGIGILIHVVEHYSYHTGQITFWTKLLKGKDLGFYTGVDLNKKNKI
jgi:uncharacterized damage-inducible protein DinB